MALNRKLLIIDDEEDLCFLLKDYFTRKNYDVYVCHTLEDGERTLLAVEPSVVFLDNNLPDGTGWTAAPQIARSFPATELVLLSAFHPEIPAMPAGAHFHLIEKPVSLSELDSKFSEIL